jgi:hypothetical protein
MVDQLQQLNMIVVLDIWRRLDVLNGRDGWTDMSIWPLSIEHTGHIL